MKHPLIVPLFLAGSALWADGGFGLGVQTAFDLGRGSALAPRLEYLYITDTSTVATPSGNVGLDATDNIVALGVDYNYFISGRTGKGLYVLGGLGVAYGNLRVQGSAPGVSATTTSNQVRVYPEGGLGYEITRHVGLEALYKALDFSDVRVAVGAARVAYSYTSVAQLALTVRF